MCMDLFTLHISKCEYPVHMKVSTELEERLD